MIRTLFLDHPQRAGESYRRHCAFALSFSGWFLLAAGAALVHAVVPALFETTASRILKRLNHKIATRH